MHLPSIPESLDADDVRAALSGLGIPVDEKLLEARFTAGSVELTFLRTGEDGNDADALIGNTSPGSRGGPALSYVTTAVAIRRKRAEQ
ncbi:hypothetical protein [Gordonia terrae]|uniref:hypothetical protein n=1 Tax=Gordonia terrae TaxID=2055 RepID=UPI003F6B6EFF